MNEPSPQLFFETANAYQRPAALKAALELELFTKIGAGQPKRAEEIATASVASAAIQFSWLSRGGRLATRTTSCVCESASTSGRPIVPLAPMTAMRMSVSCAPRGRENVRPGSRVAPVAVIRTGAGVDGSQHRSRAEIEPHEKTLACCPAPETR